MKMIKKGLTLGFGMALLSSGFAMAQSIEDAKIAISGEQYAKAESILKQLKSKSKDAEVFYHLGAVYLHNEYPDSAKATFAQGIAADPKSPLNYVGQGQVKLSKGDAAGAKADFDMAIKNAKKKDFRPHLYIAKAYLAQDKPDVAAAEAAATKALALAPKSGETYKPEAADILITMGDVYRAKRDNSKATSFYYPALDLSPAAFLDASTQLGVLYKEARAFDSGKSQLDGVIAKNANYAPAYRELAELYMQWGAFNAGSDSTSEKSQKAIDYYKKYLSLTDDSFDSKKRFAQILYYGKDFKDLQEVAKKMIAERPNDIMSNRMAGYAAAENQNSAESLTYMSKVFDLAKSTNVEVVPGDYLFLGKAQLTAGQDDQAYENIKKAVAQDSSYAPDLALVAKKYFDVKQYEKSAQIYNEAIAADSNAQGVLYSKLYLAYARYYQVAPDTVLQKTAEGKAALQNGIEAISKVIELSPSTTEAYFIKGNLQYVLDDRENPKGLFVDAYTKYAELSTAAGATPNNGNLSFAYSSLAAYYLDSDKIKAIDFLKKSLQLNPNDEWAQYQLGELTKPAKPAAKPAVKKK